MLLLCSVEVIRGDEIVLSEDEVEDEDKLLEDADDSDDYGLRGRVRITTRCLWTDNGKVLESLQKAADVALASCRKDAKLPTIERHVGVVLRKVVQKYSNRRPDVIVIATDTSEGVSADRPTYLQNFQQGQNQNQNQIQQGTRDTWSRFSSSGTMGKVVTAPLVERRLFEKRGEKKKKSTSTAVETTFPEDRVETFLPAVEIVSKVRVETTLSAVETVFEDRVETFLPAVETVSKDDTQSDNALELATAEDVLDSEGEHCLLLQLQSLDSRPTKHEVS